MIGGSFGWRIAVFGKARKYLQRLYQVVETNSNNVGLPYELMQRRRGVMFG